MKMSTRAALICLCAVVLAMGGCASGIRLQTEPVAPAEVTGTYDLLLYGCRFPSDVKNLAILVREGARYPVEIYDLPTSSVVRKGLTADEALRDARSFLQCGGIRRLDGTRLSRIPDGSGGTIGYEVRQLYFPLEFGVTDVLLVNYSLINGMVRAYVKVDPEVERAIESSGSDFHDSDHSR